MGSALLVSGKGTPGVGVPVLVAGAGDRAAFRILEFFTVNIRNPNTRAAYGRAAGAFLRWCEGQGITSLAEVLTIGGGLCSVRPSAKQRNSPGRPCRARMCGT
jgi:hypothetical protein